MSVASIHNVISAWRSFGRRRDGSGLWSAVFERRQHSAALWRGAEEKACASAAQGFETYAEEQIRGLVRQVFLSRWPKPVRQVVFCPVNENADVSELCTRIATVLAGEITADVCLVVGGETPLIHGRGNGSPLHRIGFRGASGQILSNLWMVPEKVLWDSGRDVSANLCRQLEALNREFEFSVIQGPAAGTHRRAALLGQACDGVVLALEAETTRRVAAQRAKELLSAAGVDLLGTVLCERSFPIPEAIYRRV